MGKPFLSVQASVGQTMERIKQNPASDGRAVAENLPIYADVAGKQSAPQTIMLTEHAVVTVDVENRIV